MLSDAFRFRPIRFVFVAAHALMEYLSNYPRRINSALWGWGGGACDQDKSLYDGRGIQKQTVGTYIMWFENDRFIPNGIDNKNIKKKKKET